MASGKVYSIRVDMLFEPPVFNSCVNARRKLNTELENVNQLSLRPMINFVHGMRTLPEELLDLIKDPLLFMIAFLNFQGLKLF